MAKPPGSPRARFFTFFQTTSTGCITLGRITFSTSSPRSARGSLKSPRHLALGVLAPDFRGGRAGGTHHHALFDHVDHVRLGEGIQEKFLVRFAGGENLRSRGD